MAVTKRLRYEILKRDNYTCRYCRSNENELTIDHVTPKALGGDDKPSNLVAACKDCNSGKSATPPDAPLVEEVNQQALAIRNAFQSILLKEASEVLQIQEWAEELIIEWISKGEENGMQWADPAPDALQTFTRWGRMGVPETIILDSMDIAFHARDIPQRGRYRYFCGIMHNRINAAMELAMNQEVR